MQFNRSIAFTYSWRSTLYIGLILSVAMVFILLFLQPFDTYGEEMEYKELKLTGYAVCIFIPVMLMHALERIWYRKRGYKWYLLDELLSLCVGFLLIGILSFIYNSLFINNITIAWAYTFRWIMLFGLPFIPVFLPLWAYLRFRFSKVVIATPIVSGMVTVNGKNQGETVSFRNENFIMAQAQANYVDVCIRREDTGLETHMLRTTLSDVVKEIPAAQQVHRSYLVNVDYILELQGNSRKGSVVLEHINEPVPVSPKHFSGLKEYLQIRPSASF